MGNNEVFKALFEIQKVIENPKNSKENSYHNNKYAPLNEILNYVKPLLTEHGLLLIQDVGGEESSCVFVQTKLIHIESGDTFETSKLYLKPDTQRVQQAGSAITYGKRYQLTSLLCIFGEEDDDGNNANKISKGSKKSKPKPNNDKKITLKSNDDPEAAGWIDDIVQILKEEDIMIKELTVCNRAKRLGYSDKEIERIRALCEFN